MTTSQVTTPMSVVLHAAADLIEWNDPENRYEQDVKVLRLRASVAASREAREARQTTS